MGKIKKIVVLLLLILVSCDNEPIDSAIDIDTTIQKSCKTPSSFQLDSYLDENTITLKWNPVGDETSWTVEYGLVQNFILGNGIKITSITNSCTISGLYPFIDYVFYLKANCNSGESSAWTEPLVIYTIPTN